MAVALVGVLLVMVTVPRGVSFSSQPFFIVAAAIATVLAVLVPRRAGHWSVPWPVLAFIAWCALSVLWSTAPRTSVKFVLFTTFVAVLALVVADRLPARALVRSVTAALVLALAWSLAYRAAGGARAYRPNDSLVQMFQGIYDNWNILGYTIVLLLPGLLALRPRRWSGHAAQVAVVGVAFVVLVMARSATSLIGACVLVAAALGIRLVGAVQVHQTPARGRRTWRRLGLVACALVALAVVAVTRIVSHLGKDLTTLSGRTELWGAIGTVGSEEPWTGFGWGAVWRYHWLRTPRNEHYTAVNDLIRWPLVHGHNTFFDIAIQLGAVGAALAAVALVVLVYRSVMSLALGVTRLGTWSALTALALVVVGITEPIVSTPVGWFLLVLALLVTPHVAPRTRALARSRTPDRDHDD